MHRRLSLGTLMVKTRQIRHSQKLEKFGRHVVAMRNRTQCFFIGCILKSDSFTCIGFWNKIDNAQKHKLFIAFSTTIFLSSQHGQPNHCCKSRHY